MVASTLSDSRREAFAGLRAALASGHRGTTPEAFTLSEEAVVRTGFPELDRALGGGFPRGTIATLEGPAGSGRSAIAMRLLAAATAGGLGGLIESPQDAEGALYPPALAAAGVVATLLPVADLSTRSPWPDARALLEAGVIVALATDCNPGTSFTTSMPIVVALAVTAMRMTPHEAVWAATAGGATALRRADVGRLTVGARADLIAIDAPSCVHLAYRPGVPLIHTVIRGGEVVVG